MAMRSAPSRRAARSISVAGSPAPARVRVDPGRLELGASLLEVLAIVADFFRLAEIEREHVARRPAVGDVDEHDRRFAVSRELRTCSRMLRRPANVREEREYACTSERANQPSKSCVRSQTFNAAMR